MEVSRGSGRGWRLALVALAASSIVLTVAACVLFAGWMVSPVESLSGPFGTLAPPRFGAPFGPARYQLVATGVAPVLVGGAALVADGGDVRAIGLRSRRTYWRLDRPGHVTAQSIWQIDDEYAAVLWSDRRLTVINVASGRHWDLDVADHEVTAPDVPTSGSKGLAVYGLAPSEGGSALVVVVQPREVDAYDAASGGMTWSYALARDQAILDPTSAGLPYSAQPGVSTVLLNVSTDLVGSYRETHAVVLNALGRVTLWLSSPNPAIELGGDRIGLAGSNALQVFDGVSGIPLYDLDVTDPPYATGDGSVLLAQNVARGTVSAYRAADGRTLWSDAFSGTGPQHTPGNGVSVLGLAVYAGRARVLQEYRSEYESCGPNFRLLTVSDSGAVVGIRPLSMFSCGASKIYPSLVSGGAGVVVLKDNSSILAGEQDRYAIEIG